MLITLTALLLQATATPSTPVKMGPARSSVAKSTTATPAALAEQLFDAMKREDLAVAAALFAPGAQFVLPYNPSGDASEAGTRRFPAMGYVTVATRSYDSIDFLNQTATLASDGTTLFVEAEGDLTVAASGAPYRNRYVFKFETANGKITRVTEYANAVTVRDQGIAARAPGN